MKFNEQAIGLLRSLKADVVDANRLHDGGALYWNWLGEGVTGCIRDKTDLAAFLRENDDFVNFGLSAEVFDEPAAVSGRLRGLPTQPSPVKVFLVSDWLSEAYTKIMSGDRKNALEKEVAIASMQVKRLEEEIRALQRQRTDLIFKEAAGSIPMENLKQIVEKMNAADTLFRQNQKIKKISSKGVFIPVAEKRKHFEHEQEFSACCDTIDRFLSSVQSREIAAAIRQLTAQIRDAVVGIIDNEEAIARLEKEIAEVAKKQSTISIAELTAAMSKEIEYVRDLVKLAAKRLHQENCGVLRPRDPFFTIKEVSECVDRVVEFDPQLFNNSRVQIFGIPSIVLIPGSGNALYDWKNNRIVVPLTPPAGNFMASVAFGAIEYRLDVDETKQLLTSYNKLPQHIGDKSVFTLKNELTKDYITWMTSEYRGYKNLSREVRKWFEYEIAPSKNDIAVPLPLRPFFLPTEQFNKKCKEVEALTAKGAGMCDPDLLWIAGILSYQQGKFDRAMEFFKARIAVQSNHAPSVYNLGHSCLKLMRKQEAIDSFNEYCKLNPQSWWASVAVEHVRRLQTGHGN